MKLIDKIKGRRIVVYGLLFIAMLLECAVNKITVFGFEPCFVYPVLLVSVFCLREKEATLAGLACGVIIDFQTSFVGYNAIFFVLTIYLFANLLQSVLNKNFITFIAADVVLLFVYFTLASVFYLCFGGKIGFFNAMLFTVLPKTAITAVVSVVAYFTVKLIKERFPRFFGKETKK